MPGLDALPPDQRAVLQLVLRQRRSYDDLAGLLKISAEAVRERARAGADALVPVTGPEPGEADRGRVADWLLGQGDDGAVGLLAESAPARGWARRLRSELGPLAPDGLPSVPDDPPAPARPLEPADASVGARPAEASPAPRRSSRLGGALLLGGLGVVLAALVVFLVTRGGDDEKSSASAPAAKTSTSAPATTGTGTDAIRTVAQINLKPLRTGSEALALAQLAVRGDQGAFFLAAKGLKVVAGTYHGIWLTGPKARPNFLGGIINRNVKKGQVNAQARVPDKVARYNAMLITRERGSTPARKPTRPGPTVLRGPLEVSGSAGGG